MTEHQKNKWPLNIYVLMALFGILHISYAGSTFPDPTKLIGQQISNRKYPDGWKETEDSTHSTTYNFVVLKNKNVTAYALQRVKGKDAQVMDVISIKGRPAKNNVWYQIGGQCKKNGRKISSGKDSEFFEAETVFRKCQRYSSNILNAWMVDLRTNKLTRYPTEGIRCSNNYLDSGEMSQCEFIPPEK